MKTIIHHLKTYDTRKTKEKRRAATKHFIVALPIGFILGFILRGFI